VKQKGHQERSKKIAEACENADLVRLAQDEIFGGLADSVKILKELRYSEEPNVQLNAIKHHLKLAGLEVDRSESKNSVNIVIGDDQVKKIKQAEEMLKEAK
jgi:hypothetical protein